MMTPLPENSPRTRGEKFYQESQIRTRNVIERKFGVWKRRFPILSKGINVRLRRVPGKIIILP
jgi:nuclease HARBI1